MIKISNRLITPALVIVNKRLIFLFSTVLLFSCSRNVVAQQTNVPDHKQETFYQQIWIPSKQDETYDQKIKDTLKKSLDLVFEQVFDDSICIKINDKILYERYIKTESRLSVVKDNFNVDLSTYKEVPRISLFLTTKKKFIEFKPLAGYRFVYINRLGNDSWDLSFSNYPRYYY